MRAIIRDLDEEAMDELVRSGKNVLVVAPRSIDYDGSDVTLVHAMYGRQIKKDGNGYRFRIGENDWYFEIDDPIIISLNPLIEGRFKPRLMI